MITLRLCAPIMPEGAELTAELNSDKDIDFLTKAINAAHEEADKSNVSTNMLRRLEDRLSRVEMNIVNALPAEMKLDLANGGTVKPRGR